MSQGEETVGQDFALGIEAGAVVEGAPLRGHVGGKDAIMVRKGDEVFVVGAFCSHYHGPLAEGLVVGETIRCPWHHACFSLRSGEALRAPAFDALARWRVEQVDGRIFARERVRDAAHRPAPARVPRSVIIVGAGAAGFAAVHTLRAEGYDGAIEMIGADPAEPYDRPNLSKDYLAGTAQPEWLPLRDPAWYQDQRVNLRLGRRVERIDISGRSLTLDGGETVSFDALLLATGADPIRLPIPGADRPNVFYLRSLADADRMIAACAGAKRAAVIGASFIGLEVAASLRTRGLEVHVVAPEAVPMARILGPDLGAHIRKLHESHGVVFHLENSATEIGQGGLTLKNGGTLAADIVAIGVGVRPNVALAEVAGLAVDKGVLVDAYLETAAPGVYAAGDIARWPDKITGDRIRVEHWVVAERQGQTAARNMLGRGERFDAAPFFWSQHYDEAVSYVGHAPAWDRADLSGDPASGSCEVTFYAAGRKLAVATLGRDLDSLQAELAFEKAMAAL
ncbi:nitrite reductase (NADH) large subunit [freshwater sediment metagenome]|uniref:Nitrite reductase (NADH) large subunit n=1 Tax=freshwater sediment metagenome TaxID=556182 RepID=A0AA48LZM8_9ZZZZ